MADFTADFEAGTNGNTITTAGGEASATAWAQVVGTPSYSNSHPAHGTLCAQMGSSGDLLKWVIPNTPDYYSRIYLYATAWPSGDSSTWLYLDIGGGITAATCQVRSSGVLNLAVAGSGYQGSVAIALNQWIRIEFHAVISQTVGGVELKLFNSAESSTPSETISSGFDKNNGNSHGELFFGRTGTDSWTAPIFFDDIVANATSYPGPVPDPVTATGRQRRGFAGVS